MSTDKVVWRSILMTLLSIIVLFGVMLLLLCFVFPATMMQLTYDLGMDKSSVKYAMRVYERSDDVVYVAFAMEISIQLENEEWIEEYGLQLLDDDEFETYAKLRNDEIAQGNEGIVDEQEKITLPYQQYVYGQVSIAQYAQGKVSKAQDTAFASLQGDFPEMNAVCVLFLTSMQKGDIETADRIAAEIQTYQADLPTDSADYQNAQDVLNIWQAFKN